MLMTCENVAIDGLGRLLKQGHWRSAQDALAETGVDMTRFRTGAHLASWACRTPLDNQSGKRTGRAKTKKGIGTWPAHRRDALAAGKTATREGAATGGWPAAGKPKAQVAVGNTQRSADPAFSSGGTQARPAPGSVAVNDISLHPKGAATSPIAPGLRGGQREVEPELAARRLDFVIMFLVSRIWCWRLVLLVAGSGGFRRRARPGG